MRRCIEAEVERLRLAFGQRRNIEFSVLGCSSLGTEEVLVDQMSEEMPQ